MRNSEYRPPAEDRALPGIFRHVMSKSELIAEQDATIARLRERADALEAERDGLDKRLADLEADLCRVARAVGHGCAPRAADILERLARVATAPGRELPCGLAWPTYADGTQVEPGDTIVDPADGTLHRVTSFEIGPVLAPDGEPRGTAWGLVCGDVTVTYRPYEDGTLPERSFPWVDMAGRPLKAGDVVSDVVSGESWRLGAPFTHASVPATPIPETGGGDETELPFSASRHLTLDAIALDATEPEARVIRVGTQVTDGERDFVVESVDLTSPDGPQVTGDGVTRPAASVRVTAPAVSVLEDALGRVRPRSLALELHRMLLDADRDFADEANRDWASRFASLAAGLDATRSAALRTSLGLPVTASDDELARAAAEALAPYPD